MFEQSSLLAAMPEAPPKTISKRGFAAIIGVTPGRVSQLISDGLPVEPNGRINVALGRAWFIANIDDNRRRAPCDAAGDLGEIGLSLTPRARRDLAEAEISQLKAQRLAGRLIDRRATLRVIEARAKAERDALIGWVNRAAPAIAGATGADLATVTAVLDREVREHLVAMASKPVDVPK